MPGPDRFREAATVQVDAPVDRVRELLADPAILGSLDDRLAGRDVEIHDEPELVEVHADAEGDDLELAFRLQADGPRTHVAALEAVRPAGLAERTKRMLFPGRAHAELEAELDRLRRIAETREADD
jgi:hypothetical protein